MEHQKDYSLLRQFDLEAAKRGETICKYDGYVVSFINGTNRLGAVVIQWDNEEFQIINKNNLRMAPLAWVEGKPVYNGDVLYSTLDGANFADIKTGYKFIVESLSYEKNLFDGKWYISVENLTWQKPKTKRDAWVNVYKSELNYTYCINDTEEAADNMATQNRVACCHIEWEE